MEGDFTGKQIESLAAVLYAPNEPMKIETILVDPPKAKEVRVKIITCYPCLTDNHYAEGKDSESQYPCVLGHEASAIVVDVGEGVTSVKPGDVVIPAYTPQCYECKYCKSDKTNLCVAIRATQGKGVMPDGTVRLHTKDGKDIYHFMGISGFSQYTVCAEISCVKLDEKKFDAKKAALCGCGVVTGYGCVFKTAKVEKDSTCVVIGLGAVGLAMLYGCKDAGAKRIIGVDLNDSKFELAKTLGATECINPKDLDCSIEEYIVKETEGGADYVFEAVGIKQTMESGIKMAARGWGKVIIAGVMAGLTEISARPFLFITGRTLTGTAFGGVKSREEQPYYIEKTYPVLDHFITGERHLRDLNEAFDDMKRGQCIRTAINFD